MSVCFVEQPTVFPAIKNLFWKFLFLLILFIITSSCSTNRIFDESGQEDISNPDHFLPDENTTVLKVGRNKEFTTINAASLAATDSCIIEIDAGTYSGDVARWTQDNLILRAVGGEVVLDAAGKNFGDMGIWVVNGGNVYVEGITFRNAKVRDRNGAGIRLVKGFLTVKNCRFLFNETGILTSNDGVSTLNVLNSEFGYNSAGDGFSHNIYVGKMAYFSVSGSWFHHEDEGHLIKTRAKVSLITYNLIADGNDASSRASYEIDFASGGICVVVGNIIQQSKNSRNSTIISYSNESDRPWDINELYVSYNTIINGRTNTDLIINSPQSPVMYQGAFNNVLSKNTRFNMNFMDIETNNIWFETDDLTSDYAPTKKAYDSWLNKTDTDVDRHLTSKLKAMGISLVPKAEYKHPMTIKPLDKTPVIPGAIQSPAL